MFSSVADIQSNNPQRVLKMLCNHWRHKFEIVSNQEGHALIDLGDRGRAEFTIQNNSLHTVATHHSQEQLPALLVAIQNHLQRFAKDETLEFTWQ